MNKKLEQVLRRVQKPGRYTGGELGAVYKNPDDMQVHFAFCFPDIYDVGMSHLGLKILYALLNNESDVFCERVFAPWDDMEREMRNENIPLCGLESGTPLNQFDIIGFTLQYELSYTSILNMLDLGGIAPRCSERGDALHGLVIAGGPCAFNPEPLAEFIDLFVLGEGEEVTLELVELYKKCKSQGKNKTEFLRLASGIQGIYAPSLYEVSYNSDGTISGIKSRDDAPPKVKKRIIEDFDAVFFPGKLIVPFVDVIHDRITLELFRGCVRGCRFCQAGMIYRPVREKKPGTLNGQAKNLQDCTGYEEVSLASLSTSDYSCIEELTGLILEWSEGRSVGLSLPSLRADGFSMDLMERVQTVRKSGLTFAPEAGSQRLRDVINKNVREEELLNTCKIAFEGGYTNIKLYFMLGLPTETMQDIEEIDLLARKVVDTYYKCADRGRRVNVSVSVSTFVPKAHTPFQWEAQDSEHTIREKQKFLLDKIKTKRQISLSWNECGVSIIEAAIARGDRRLSEVIYQVWKKGAKLEAWDEFFSYNKWIEAFEQCGLNPEYYTTRKRGYDEILPWSVIDCGVSSDYLKRESEKAVQGLTTKNCREKCGACGADKLMGGNACVLSGKS